MGGKQDSKREAALDLILAGRTNPEVAAELGVRRETVWKWTRDPDFAAALCARRAALRYAVDEVLRGGALRAARYLAELVSDFEAPHTARVRAACALLDRVGAVATEARSVDGIERWEELEAQRQREQALALVMFGG